MSPVSKFTVALLISWGLASYAQSGPPGGGPPGFDPSILACMSDKGIPTPDQVHAAETACDIVHQLGQPPDFSPEQLACLQGKGIPSRDQVEAVIQDCENQERKPSGEQ